MYSAVISFLLGARSCNLGASICQVNHLTVTQTGALLAVYYDSTAENDVSDFPPKYKDFKRDDGVVIHGRVGMAGKDKERALNGASVVDELFRVHSWERRDPRDKRGPCS